MQPINNFAYAKSHTSEDEKILFECRADKNFKPYALMMFSIYLVIGILIASFIFMFTDNSDDIVTTLVPVMMVFIYICYEYAVETIKISRNQYRLTNLHCFITSKYLSNTLSSISYNKIARIDILKRPWQDWFGLTTIRLIEKKNVSPAENPQGEDFIRLVSKTDAEIIVGILKQHIKPIKR